MPNASSEHDILVKDTIIIGIRNDAIRKKLIAETDHKPLESICKKSVGNGPPRLQRILRELTPYDTKMKWQNVSCKLLKECSVNANLTELKLALLDTQRQSYRLTKPKIMS